MTGLPEPFHWIALERVESTNDELARLARAGSARHGTVVSAAEQTAGRGRRRREWFSPRGNLHCSILLDAGEPGRAPQLAFVAAVALREALAELLPGAGLRCKWPNDILCEGRKVAGMLLEAAATGTILGVGVNVRHAPERPAYPATSLAEQGAELTPETVLAAFCARLAVWHPIWRAEGLAPVLDEWRRHAAGLGEGVVARLADGTERSGRFAGLDADGALLLEAEGRRERIMAGDIFFAGKEAGHAAGH